MIAPDWKDYEVIATGDGEKLERWGEVYLLRPDPQVIWSAPFDLASYPKLHAHYIRCRDGGGKWEYLKPMPAEWSIAWRDCKFLIKPMGFKHTGLFPEQAYNWDKMGKIVESSGKRLNVLNLFGYTGGATVALAKRGAFVTHVDAAKGMVERCKQNANLSGVSPDGIRYIVDDCKKFVTREIKRGKKYDAVLMDPPSYGRGPSGETWKIEDELFDLVKLVTQVLDEPQFYLINSYTTGLQPTVIKNMLSLAMDGGVVDGYELNLPVTNCPDGKIELPCGCSGIWTKK
ncbi:MAG: class I SAM-dependent methyltransferase [Clostridia bacterium]|nr:class I SAM-dependent methyltransferase [Clostridia bacterium]